MDLNQTMKGSGKFLNPKHQGKNGETKQRENTESANRAGESIDTEMAGARTEYEARLRNAFGKKSPDANSFTDPDSIHFEKDADKKSGGGFEPKTFSDTEIREAAYTSNILGDPTDIHEAPDKTSSDLTQTNPLSEKKPSDTSGGFKATSLHGDW